MTGRSDGDGFERWTTTFSSWGHPAIRATHRGSLELTREREISRRATCVVGVAAAVDESDLHGYVGPVTITLKAGPYSHEVHATAHPGFRLGRSMVVRRSQHRSANTFAVGADTDAGALPRQLADVLADPDVRLVVTVTGRRSPQAARGAMLTVAWVPGTGPGASTDRVAERLQAADLVLRDGTAGAVGDVLRKGGRVVLLLAEDVTTHSSARRVVAEAVNEGVPVEVHNLPSELAALLLAGFDAHLPVWLARVAAGRGGEVPAYEVLARGAIWIGSLTAGALTGLLEEVERRLGEVAVCAFVDARSPEETVVRGTAGSVLRAVRGSVRRTGRSLLVMALPGQAAPASRSASEIDLLAALAREGVPQQTLARAASSAWGLSRRQAYALVQALRDVSRDADGPRR